MESLDVGTSTIAYRYDPSPVLVDGRPTIMFCHALATDMTIWSRQLAAFGAVASTLAFDLPGHGRSHRRSDQSFEFVALADIARALLDHLALGKVHVVGVSVGGEVAQAFAARYPERIAKLVLTSTACYSAPARATLWHERIEDVRRGGMAGIADATAKRWFSEPFAKRFPDIVRSCRDAIAATDPFAYMALGEVIGRMDLRDGNGSIKAPTLVTYGTLDHNTGARAAELIVATIAGAQTEAIEASGHFPQLEVPDHWNRAVLRFLELA